MLNLRKLEPSDLPYLYRWENDASVWSHGAAHNPLSQQDLRDYIASTTGDIFRDGQLRLVVEADGATVGCVDLVQFDARNRKAEAGIYIAPQYRGRGVGEECLHALRDYCKVHLGMRLLYAYVGENNSASRALFEKVGFLCAGVVPCWTLEGSAILYTLSL